MLEWHDGGWEAGWELENDGPTPPLELGFKAVVPGTSPTIFAHRYRPTRFVTPAKRASASANRGPERVFKRLPWTRGSRPRVTIRVCGASGAIMAKCVNPVGTGPGATTACRADVGGEDRKSVE